LRQQHLQQPCHMGWYMHERRARVVKHVADLLMGGVSHRVMVPSSCSQQ
jgi:hypothetical protein